MTKRQPIPLIRVPSPCVWDCNRCGALVHIGDNHTALDDAMIAHRCPGQHALEAATAELLDRVRSTETIDKVFDKARCAVAVGIPVSKPWSPYPDAAGVVQPPTRTR